MAWDYRDRHGVFWRYDDAEGTWSSYDGAQWVTSAGPPPKWASRFNPLTAEGRKANQSLWAMTLVLCGLGLIATGIPFHLPSTIVVGTVMIIFSFVLGVRSFLPRSRI